MLPLLVVTLRSLPFLVAVTQSPDGDELFIPTGYIPKDFLAYVALIRQVTDQGSWLLANPFTTAPQSNRFVLILHLSLGLVSRLTGLDPFWVFELSRVPLTFAFFLVLWRFCRLVFPDRTHQLWAYWLVGLSGGLEAFAKLAAPWLPEPIAGTVREDLWHLFGWSTFAALYNPLWTAGLTLTLLTLEPILKPSGPDRPRDFVQASLGLIFVQYTHNYSAIVVIAVAVARPVVAWLFEEQGWLQLAVRTAAALAPAAVIIAAVTIWQLQDRVFAESSREALGRFALPVFWYPATLGLVGVFAVRGLRRLADMQNTWRYSLGAWIAAVVFLHTSPLLNGYHFVFQLHLPLCLVAAPAVACALRRPSAGLGGRLLVGLALVALFVSSEAVTIESVWDVLHVNRIPRARFAVVQALASEPPGHVLAPRDLGNLIPAYRAHRVYVGHWFLTPDWQARDGRYVAAVNDPARTGELVDLVEQERIRYLVAPGEQANRLAGVLGDRVMRRMRVNGFEVFVLSPTNQGARNPVWRGARPPLEDSPLPR